MQTPKEAIAQYLTDHYSKRFYGNLEDAHLAEMVLHALEEAGYEVVASTYDAKPLGVKT